MEMFLLFIFVIYGFYILFIISGLFRHNTIKSFSEKELPSASIIIAARNEEKNLPNLIEDLSKQDYPLDKLEIIIVNDRSTDKTSELLNEANKKYEFINSINITKTSSEMTPKKNALNRGILKSKGEIIVSTDADCRVGKSWVMSMVNSTLKSNGISIGYSKVSASSLFEKYQLIDFLGIIISNAGASGWGCFWSGTGQNLAYFREDYDNINGFESVRNEVSGDDMYLVQSISKIKTGFININPESYVQTKPMKTLKSFINQRIRWASNSRKNFKNNLFFFTFLTSAFISNIFLMYSFIIGNNWILFFLIKYLLEGLVLFLGGKLFNTRINLFVYTLWAIFQPLYIPLVAILGLRNKYSWKP
jgi:poly-beta-1,6-N-acetyl-D-glucosamine synthase